MIVLIIIKEKVNDREASENVDSFFTMLQYNGHPLLSLVASQYEQVQAYQLLIADIHFDWASAHSDWSVPMIYPWT